MSFDINLVSVDGYGKRTVVCIAKCKTVEECFDVLHKLGHDTQQAQLLDASLPNSHIAAGKSKNRLDIAYIGAKEPEKVGYQAISEELSLQIRPDSNSDFYLITDNDDKVAYSSFRNFHASWSRKSIARKIFHPGNSLTVAVVLTAVSIGLIGFGVACPPALVFVALGFAAFSAISAIVYAADWFARDWNCYKAMHQAEIDNGGHAGVRPTFSHYISQYPSRLIAWAKAHKLQAFMMGIGAVVFLGALAVVAGHFIAIAITGAGFAFMTVGTSGGALGLTSSFFAAGFGAISGLTSSVSAVLTSAFAATTLVLGPTNIVDSIRRFFSGVTKSDEADEPPPRDLPNELLGEKPDLAKYKVWQNAGSNPEQAANAQIKVDLNLYDGTHKFD